MVDTLMRTAATAGGMSTPAHASAPAATGMATMLYPAAQPRFWRLLR